MQTKEDFYDNEVAPKLRELAQRCADNDMSFVAAVEYEPGHVAHVEKMASINTWAMDMVSLAIHAMGNLDKLALNVAAQARYRQDVDANSSIIIRWLNQQKPSL
jgi:hypothetical protein